MTNKISCILVDDDKIDILNVQSFLEGHLQFEITGVFQSPLSALEFAQKSPPDILFLDVDMPGLTGLQLRKKLLNVSACVFITSYPDFAVDGFEVAAFDYIVKPFSIKRFNQTIQRLVDFFAIKQKAQLLDHTLGGDTIFIKDGTTQIKLQLHDIIYVEALNNYTSIVTSKRKYAVLSTLGTLLKENAFSHFIRIHRSYAVQKSFINKVSADEILLTGNIALPVGRTYKQALKGIRL